MAIPGINSTMYNLLYSAATSLLDAGRPDPKLGLNTPLIAELVRVLEYARQGNTTAFETSPDLVAMAYRVLEASSSFSSHPDAARTLDALRPVASQSTWARRAAGSSGIFGNAKSFTQAEERLGEKVDSIAAEAGAAFNAGRKTFVYAPTTSRYTHERLPYTHNEGLPMDQAVQLKAALEGRGYRVSIVKHYEIEPIYGRRDESQRVHREFELKIWPPVPPVPSVQPPVVHSAAQQSAQLTSLLQNKAFAEEMATWLDGAYYRGQGQTPPKFQAQAVEKSVHENVAMNLAGFYAVESGIGFIAEQTGQTPAQILQKIVDGTLPEADMLLLARFANATWKAGQPFRDLARIARANFVPATLLGASELRKDFDQLKAVAELLLPKVSHSGDVAQQREILKTLLQSQEFAVEMATWLDGAYYRGQGQVPPAFDAKPVTKSIHENIAMNLAGFYAVEAGVGLLAERTGQTPLEILRQIHTGSLPREDMLLLARFANATWKAGQPFRDLGRIARANFVPAVLLSHAELEKDFVQIRAAAEKMLYAVALGHSPESITPEFSGARIERNRPETTPRTEPRTEQSTERYLETMEALLGRRLSNSERERLSREHRGEANDGGRAGSTNEDKNERNKPKGKPRGPRGK